MAVTCLLWLYFYPEPFGFSHSSTLNLLLAFTLKLVPQARTSN